MVRPPDNSPPCGIGADLIAAGETVRSTIGLPAYDVVRPARLGRRVGRAPRSGEPSHARLLG